jgi:hypothetical protein
LKDLCNQLEYDKIELEKEFCLNEETKQKKVAKRQTWQKSVNLDSVLGSFCGDQASIQKWNRVNLSLKLAQAAKIEFKDGKPLESSVLETIYQLATKLVDV